MKDGTRRCPPTGLVALLALAVAALILHEVWPERWVLMSPDSAPLYPEAFKHTLFNGWINHQMQPMSHDALLALLLPPLLYHDLSYMVSAALIAWAVALYLRQRRLPWPAVLSGSLTMAFCGYHFTLFNPGHRGYFVMMPYAIALLALVERAAVRPRWSQFALMGLCVAYGVGYQPDVLAVLLGIVFGYALLRAWQSWRTASTPERRRLARGWSAGVLVGAATVTTAGLSPLQRTATHSLQTRERQLAQAVEASPEAAASPAEARHRAWLFATNWSLPPEDLLELIAPNLRGFDSGNPDGPYWGRLGESPGWPEGEPGFPNLRGHSLYLGVLPLLLALYAVAGGWRRPADEAPADDAPTSTEPGLTRFWLGIALVCLVLALGRHTPLYRLVYALPGMSHFRAPVKFLHGTELAVALLSALGMARVLRAAQSRGAAARRDARGCAILAAGLVVTLLLAAALTPGAGFVERLEALGLEAFEALLRTRWTSALLRSAGLLGLGAALFAVLGWGPERLLRRVAAPSLWLVLGVTVLDLASAARPYVNPIDSQPFTARNPIADALLAEGPPDGVAVANRLGALRTDHPLLWAFWREGFDLADRAPNLEAHWPIAITQERFAEDIRRRWMLWGTRAVMIPLQAVETFVADPEFSLLGTYALAAGRLVAAPVSAADFAAVRFESWVPPAALYQGWRSVGADDLWPTLADPELDLLREAVVLEGPEPPRTDSPAPARAADLVLPASRAAHRRAEVRVLADAPGLLVLRTRFDDAPRVMATVNGVRQPALSANGFFWAVPVPAGESTVLFEPVLAWWRLGLHVAGGLLALAALGWERRASRMETAGIAVAGIA